MRSSMRRMNGLAAFFTLLPICGHAQSPGSVMMERVMGPNGEERKLRSHPSPLPPPVSDLQPLGELMSVHAGGKVQSYAAFARQYTATHIDVLTYHYENMRSG